MSKENYREVAKKLGVHYLFGRWGFSFLCRDPAGKVHKLFQITPLDGWSFDKHELVQAMLDDPAFEVDLHGRTKR